MWTVVKLELGNGPGGPAYGNVVWCRNGNPLTGR
jgi:hypothetical protein